MCLYSIRRQISERFRLQGNSCSQQLDVLKRARQRQEGSKGRIHLSNEEIPAECAFYYLGKMRRNLKSVGGVLLLFYHRIEINIDFSSALFGRKYILNFTIRLCILHTADSWEITKKITFVSSKN